MNVEKYRQLYNPDVAVGWHAIETHLEHIYPELSPNYKLNNPTEEYPLEGLCHYTTPNFEHYISFGFSELYYNEESAGADFSKFGFELSLRVNTQKETATWVYQLFQHLASYVFESGNWFEANHFIEIEGGLSQKDPYAGIAFMADATLKELHTPHGWVQFLQIVPLMQEEIQLLSQKASLDFTEKFLREKTKNNPLSIITL